MASAVHRAVWSTWLVRPLRDHNRRDHDHGRAGRERTRSWLTDKTAGRGQRASCRTAERKWISHKISPTHQTSPTSPNIERNRPRTNPCSTAQNGIQQRPVKALLIRRFWVQVPGGAPHKAWSEPPSGPDCDSGPRAISWKSDRRMGVRSSIRSRSARVWEFRVPLPFDPVSSRYGATQRLLLPHQTLRRDRTGPPHHRSRPHQTARHPSRVLDAHRTVVGTETTETVPGDRPRVPASHRPPRPTRPQTHPRRDEQRRELLQRHRVERRSHPSAELVRNRSTRLEAQRPASDLRRAPAVQA